MLERDSAVCIRAVDYSETSQVVTFFTKQRGKLGAIAKGSKRPKSSFDGPIELFAHGQIVYSRPHTERLATLTEFQQKMPFRFLTRNLYALHCASLAAELINSMTDECDPHPQLFDAFIRLLEEIEKHSSNNQSRDVMSWLIIFQLKLLKEIGLMPVLDHCVNCKTRYEIRDTRYDYFFSSSANGLICRDCEAAFPDKIRFGSDAVEALTDPKKLNTAGEKTLRQIEKVLISHFTQVLHRPVKMARYILKA